MWTEFFIDILKNFEYIDISKYQKYRIDLTLRMF